MSKFIGIDISKASFDVSFLAKDKNKHEVYSNDKVGFKKLMKQVCIGSTVVMEASGPYYGRLAHYLYGQGIKVSVVNPLKIKRFSQMNFNRAKTDKKDALVIREYAEKMKEELDYWQPEDSAVKEMKQLNSSIELLNKQLTQSRNQLHAYQATGHISKELKQVLTKTIKNLKSNIAKLENRLLEIANTEYKETMELLTSIPCIGSKTASMLISITNNFKKFSHYKQLIAYVGFSPRVYQSGTSVRGKGHICKMGKSQIRKLLYMCSWTAKKYNVTCKEMYDRLKEKGKPERVIKVAIANKLLKQCFAIATKREKYNINFN